MACCIIAAYLLARARDRVRDVAVRLGLARLGLVRRAEPRPF